MRKVPLLLASAGVAVLLASGAALAASQLDQQQTAESDFVGIPDANNPYGQTFTAGLTGSLDKVSVLAGCCMWIDSNAGGIGGSPPGDMIVQIFAVDASGFPTGAALAQGSVPAANFTTSAALSWRDVNVSPAVMVSAGTKYALVMTSSQTAGSPPQEYRYMWRVANSDAYSRGIAMFKSGTQWFSMEQDDFTFKTFVDVPDTTAPRVTGVSPTGTGVALGANLTASFSEEMNKSTLTKSTFKLFKVVRSADGSTTLQQITNVGVTPSGDGLRAKLDPYPSEPSRLLAANTKYKAIITKGAQDLAGNSLSQPKSWTFTTR